MGFLDTRRQRTFRPVPQNLGGGSSFSPLAPYLGLNLRDSVTALQAGEARLLDNWFPDLGKLSVRPGYDPWATGVGAGRVATLATHHSLTAQSLLASSVNQIYNATTEGSAVSLGSGFTEGTWQTENFHNVLFFVNGVDGPQAFDGTTLGPFGFTWATGDITDIINVAAVHERLWFVPKNSGLALYGDPGAIAGTLTEFDVGQIASGGFLMAIGSWSVDSGDGADDFTVFVMSTGQMLVYAGDPATTFILVGVLGGQDSSEPIGRQCLFNQGGELNLITTTGIIPISTALSPTRLGGEVGTLDLSSIEPWGKVASGIASEAVTNSTKPGWHGVFASGIGIINVPLTTGLLSRQYILNARTGAWATWSGHNGARYRPFQQKLYFGSETGGNVMLVGAQSDNGATIVASARSAFSRPTDSRSRMLYTMVRPQLQAQGDVNGFIGVDTDYFETTLAGPVLSLVDDIETTPWSSPWSSPWGSKPQPLEQWFGCIGEGRSVAVKMQLFAVSFAVSWLATDILMKPGNIK